MTLASRRLAVLIAVIGISLFVLIWFHGTVDPSAAEKNDPDAALIEARRKANATG